MDQYSNQLIERITKKKKLMLTCLFVLVRDYFNLS